MVGPLPILSSGASGYLAKQSSLLFTLQKIATAGSVPGIGRSSKSFLSRSAMDKDTQ
jgi:hypothetical protein